METGTPETRVAEPTNGKSRWTPEARAAQADIMKTYRRNKTKKLHWTQTAEGKVKLSASQLNKVPIETQIKAVHEWEKEGVPSVQVAAKYGVAKTTLYQWKYALRDKGLLRKRRNNADTGLAVVHVEPGATPPEIDIEHQNQISFAVGYIKSWLQIYADGIEVPTRQFTRRVGELLLRTSHR
jgi:transposase-like protein